MLTTIYLARHGFRLSWETPIWTSPTGTPRDPPLSAHGEDQARQLAAHLASLPANQQPTAILSSPLYRCLQTAQPAARALALPIAVEHGVGEWYLRVPEGSRTRHPVSRPAAELKRWFEEIDEGEGGGESLHYPDRKGESEEEVHARAEEVLRKVIARCEEKGIERLIIFTHAATNIAMARALCASRSLPVRSATCSLAEFHRAPAPAPTARGGLGSWTRVRDGDTSFLARGEERHWEFSYVEAYEEEGVAEDGTEVGAMKSDAYAVPQGGPQAEVEGAKVDDEAKGTDKRSEAGKGGKL